MKEVQNQTNEHRIRGILDIVPWYKHISRFTIRGRWFLGRRFTMLIRGLVLNVGWLTKGRLCTWPGLNRSEIDSRVVVDFKHESNITWLLTILSNAMSLIVGSVPVRLVTLIRWRTFYHNVSQQAEETALHSGSNGPCFVRTDIRMDICVNVDILELSVLSRISVLTYGYPWRIVRSTWISLSNYPC